MLHFEEPRTPTTEQRASMIERIRAHAKTYDEFAGEVSYFVNDIGDREYAYDELSALFDIEDRNEDKDGDRALLTFCRCLLIDIGFYRVMPQDEIDATTVSHGTPWAFKHKRVAYTTDQIVEDWQFPEEDK